MENKQIDKRYFSSDIKDVISFQRDDARHKLINEIREYQNGFIIEDDDGASKNCYEYQIIEDLLNSIKTNQ
jgi:hypothetical protein